MRFQLTPAQVILLAYTLVTIIGTLLLMLPLSHTQGEFQKPVDAFFTAVSALSVTGLTVVETGTYYSLFGQIILLILIQIGGLGYMTMATLMGLMIGRRIGLKDRLTLQAELNQFGIGGLIQFTTTIAKIYFALELIGFLLLYLFWSPSMGWEKGFYYSLFHAISGFNSAGFSLYSNSMMEYRADWATNLILTTLIIIGGLGAIVLFEILQYLKYLWERLKRQNRPSLEFILSRPRWSLHTKVVLTFTIAFYFLGTVFLFFFEPSFSGYRWDEKLLASYFQSVNARSGGFNSVDIAALSSFGLVMLSFLMFIGAGANSTGGGIRVTTLAVILAACWAIIAGRSKVELFKRTISEQIVYRAFTITVISILWISIATLVLMESQQGNPLHIVFDVVSAFGTCGLSTGVSSNLTDLGKMTLALTMLFGRVGVLTFMIALLQRPPRPEFTYPNERIMVG